MAKKLRKEKYIKNRVGRDGKQFFQVSIEYWDDEGSKQQYNKSFNEKDYDSPSLALDAACIHRNNILVQVKGNRRKPAIKKEFECYTVKEVFDKSRDLLICSKKTWNKLNSLYKYNIQPFDPVNIRDITTVDIQLSVNARVNDSSNDKLARLLYVWKRIFHTAIVMGVVDKDPTIAVVLPKSKKPQVKRKVMTTKTILDDAIGAIRKHTHKTDEHLFNAEIIIYALKTIYYTGLRPSECFALSRSDVNLNTETITLKNRIGSTAEKENVLVALKSEDAIRTLPIVEELHDILNELMQFQDSHMLFTKFDGSLMNISHIDSKIKYACKSEGFEFNMYQLRHLFGTDLITNNVDSRTIQELMGHASYSMSVSYARSSEERKKDALDKRHLS